MFRDLHELSLSLQKQILKKQISRSVQTFFELFNFSIMFLLINQTCCTTDFFWIQFLKFPNDHFIHPLSSYLIPLNHYSINLRHDVEHLQLVYVQQLNQPFVEHNQREDWSNVWWHWNDQSHQMHHDLFQLTTRETMQNQQCRNFSVNEIVSYGHELQHVGYWGLCFHNPNIFEVHELNLSKINIWLMEVIISRTYREKVEQKYIW